MINKVFLKHFKKHVFVHMCLLVWESQSERVNIISIYVRFELHEGRLALLIIQGKSGLWSEKSVYPATDYSNHIKEH